MRKTFLIIAVVIMVNIILYTVFAFATWELNPKYWVIECRALCAFLMCAITFAAFLYFIIELSDKKQL